MSAVGIRVEGLRNTITVASTVTQGRMRKSLILVTLRPSFVASAWLSVVLGNPGMNRAFRSPQLFVTAAEPASATETAGAERTAQDSAVGARETRSREEKADLGGSRFGTVQWRIQGGSIHIEPSECDCWELKRKCQL
jgi:hypothetical protein